MVLDTRGGSYKMPSREGGRADIPTALSGRTAKGAAFDVEPYRRVWSEQGPTLGIQALSVAFELDPDFFQEGFSFKKSRRHNFRSRRLRAFGKHSELFRLRIELRRADEFR